ncbi:hypothetical protein EB118_12495 [bacterium]|nr:hypothetical protein [bacterium]NDD83734.1 hypothetical protein [bacterium]NDG30878.1 hypothetical protein [bacterium]
MCDNAKEGTSLYLACMCKKASEELEKSAKIYNTTLEKYNKKLVEFNNAQSKYEGDIRDWRNRRDNKRKDLSNERSYRGCGTCGGGNQGCQGGWEWADNNNGCNLCLGKLCSNSGCEQICKRSGGEIDREMNSWYAGNPEPQAPSDKEFKSLESVVKDNVPRGNQVTCCSQMFENVTAQSVNFNDVKQNCNNKIDQDIQNAQKAEEEAKKKAKAARIKAAEDKNNPIIATTSFVKDNEYTLAAGGGGFSLLLIFVISCCCTLVILLLLLSGSSDSSTKSSTSSSNSTLPKKYPPRQFKATLKPKLQTYPKNYQTYPKNQFKNAP